MKTISRLKFLILAIIILIGFFVFFKFRHHYSLENILSYRNEILSLIATHETIVFVVFSILFLIVSIVFIPGIIAPMSILSGFIFGGFWGGLVTVILAAFGSGIAFTICRNYLLDFAYSKFSHQKKLNEFISKNGAASILILRFFPIIPFPFINILAAISSIRFLTFFIASGVGKIPLAFIYSFAGSELRDANNVKDILNYKIICLLFLLMAVVVIGNLIKNKILKNK